MEHSLHLFSAHAMDRWPEPAGGRRTGSGVAFAKGALVLCPRFQTLVATKNSRTKFHIDICG